MFCRPMPPFSSFVVKIVSLTLLMVPLEMNGLVILFSFFWNSLGGTKIFSSILGMIMVFFLCTLFQILLYFCLLGFLLCPYISLADPSTILLSDSCHL